MEYILCVYVCGFIALLSGDIDRSRFGGRLFDRRCFLYIYIQPRYPVHLFLFSNCSLDLMNHGLQKNIVMGLTNLDCSKIVDNDFKIVQAKISNNILCFR